MQTDKQFNGGDGYIERKGDKTSGVAAPMP